MATVSYTLRDPEYREDLRTAVLVDVHLVPMQDLGAFSASSKLVNAVLFAGFPQVGQPHPAYPNLFCERIESRLAPDGVVEVRIEYHAPPLNQIDWSNAARSEDTNLDSAGFALVTTHDGENQGHMVTRLVPQQMVIFRALMVPTLPEPWRNPLLLCKQILGKSNSDLVAAFPAGALQGEWLVTSVTVHSWRPTLGEAFEVEIQFTRHPATWRAKVVHVDGDDHPIPNPAAGSSLKDFELYRKIPYLEIPGLS